MTKLEHALLSDLTISIIVQMQTSDTVKTMMSKTCTLTHKRRTILVNRNHVNNNNFQ